MKVPASVVFFARLPRPVQLFDGTTVQVRDTYPAYPESKARMKSGREWAEKGNDFRWDKPDRKVKVDEVALPNKFHGLTIQSLEVRGEGGRAYKVIVDGYMFDLREKTLIDIFGSVGIAKGGYVDADFCFVGEGAEFKLVRFGSAQHEEMLALDEKFRVKPTGTYTFGHIYENQNKTAIYLGMVLVSKVQFQAKPDVPDHHRLYYDDDHLRDCAEAKYNEVVPVPGAKAELHQLWHHGTELPKKLEMYSFILVKNSKKLPTGKQMENTTLTTTAEVLDAYSHNRRDKMWLYRLDFQLRTATAAEHTPTKPQA